MERGETREREVERDKRESENKGERETTERGETRERRVGRDKGERDREERSGERQQIQTHGGGGGVQGREEGGREGS